MFRTSATRIRTWWADATADILGADLPPTEPVAGTIEYFRSHPHRYPLGSGRERRAGSVAARPAYCVSPVRPASSDRAQRGSLVRQS